MATVTGPAARQNAKYDTFVEAQLDKARKRIRTLDVMTALLGFAAGTLAYAVVMALLDNALTLPTPALYAAFFVYLTGAAVYLGLTVVRPLTARINPYFAARQVEQTLPGAKNSVVNWLDLHGDDKLPAAIQGSLSQKAARDLSHADLEKAVSGRRAGWMGGVVTGLTLILLVLLFTLGGRKLLSHLGRAFLPFSGTSIATRTRIVLMEPEAGNVQIAADRAFTVRVRIEGRVPPALKLLTRPTKSDPEQEYGLDVDKGAPGEWVATVPAADVKNGFYYRVIGGDASTAEYYVDVRATPAILGDQFTATYRLRPYLGQKVERVQPKEREIKDYRGTTVTLDVPTNRKLKSGQLALLIGNKTTVIPAQIVAGNDSALRVRFVLEKSGKYVIRFTSVEGEHYVDPQVFPVIVKDDKPPTVVLTKPAKDETLPADALLKLEGKAIDDIGVKAVTLRLKTAAGVLLQPKPYRSDAELKLRDGGYLHVLDYKDFLDLAQVKDAAGKSFALKPGMVLEYWLEARDACDYPKPNVAESKHYKVTIAEPRRDPMKKKQERQQAEQEKQQNQKKQDEQKAKENQQRREQDKKQEDANNEAKKKDGKEGDGQEGEGKGGKGKDGKPEKGGAKDENGKNGEGGQDNRTADQKKKDEETAKKNERLKKEIEKAKEEQRKNERAEGKPENKEKEPRGSAKDNGENGKQQDGKPDQKEANGAGKGNPDKKQDDKGNKGKGQGEKDAGQDKGAGKAQGKPEDGKKKDQGASKDDPGRKKGENQAQGKDDPKQQQKRDGRGEGKGDPEKKQDGKENKAKGQGQSEPKGAKGKDAGKAEKGGEPKADKKDAGGKQGEKQASAKDGKEQEPGTGQPQQAKTDDRGAAKGKKDGKEGAGQDKAKGADSSKPDKAKSAGKDGGKQGKEEKAAAKDGAKGEQQAQSKDGGRKDQQPPEHAEAKGKGQDKQQAAQDKGPGKEGQPEKSKGKNADKEQVAQGKQATGKGEQKTQTKGECKQCKNGQGDKAGTPKPAKDGARAKAEKKDGGRDHGEGTSVAKKDRVKGDPHGKESLKKPAEKVTREDVKDLAKDLDSSDAKTRKDAAKKLDEVRRDGKDDDVRQAAEKELDDARRGKGAASAKKPPANKPDQLAKAPVEPKKDPGEQKTGKSKGQGKEQEQGKGKDKGKPEKEVADVGRGKETGGRGLQQNADPLDLNPDGSDGRFNNRAGSLQLDKLDPKMRKKVLDDAGLTEKDVARIKEWERRNPPLPDDPKRPIARRPGGKALATTGAQRVGPVDDGLKGSDGNGDGLPPLEYRNAYKRLTRPQSGTK